TVQPQHIDILGRKIIAHFPGLRQAVADTAGAEHLEGVDHHHLAALVNQCRWLPAVKPVAQGQRWSGCRREFTHLSVSLEERSHRRPPVGSCYWLALPGRVRPPAV